MSPTMTSGRAWNGSHGDHSSPGYRSLSPPRGEKARMPWAVRCCRTSSGSESRVKMAQEHPGLTLPNVDLTRHAGSSCSIRLLVTYPMIDERRQMVSSQRRRYAPRTSKHPQFRWSDQVLTLERLYLVHCWWESDTSHEVVRQVGLLETEGRNDGTCGVGQVRPGCPSLPLQHLRHARLRRPIPTSARAWWRVPTPG